MTLNDYIKKLSNCIGEFGTNNMENMHKIIGCTGSLLRAKHVMYSIVHDDKLITICGWCLPDNYIYKSATEGHICVDMLQNGTVAKPMVILHNTPATKHKCRFFKVDDNNTYVGYTIYHNNKKRGVLCLLFEDHYEVNETEETLLNMVAAAISVEEERHLCKQKLQRSLEFTDAIVEDSIDMIVATDVNGNICRFNKAAQQCFGYRQEEIIGKSVHTLYADKKEHQRIINDIKINGKFYGEVLNVRKNGDKFISLLSASMLHDNNNEFLGVVGTSRDITDQKVLEDYIDALMKDRSFYDPLRKSKIDLKNALSLINNGG